MAKRHNTTSELPVPARARKPPSEQRPYVVVIAGSHTGEQYALGLESAVGRSDEAEITIVDEGISRRHCLFVQIEPGVTELRDLGSTNGTFVNGDRIDTIRVQEGDKVQVGTTTVLKFTYQDELDEGFQRQLFESALTDDLTKAFNRRYFERRMETEYAYSDRHDLAMSLLIIDFDHFKRVNDEYGHLAGDYVLRSIAHLIAETLRTEDVFARLGGEEFGVLCRGISAKGAKVLAERLRKTIEGYPLRFEQQELSVTVSIGAASRSNQLNTPARLLEAADRALYVAKDAGRNMVVLHEDE